MRINITLLAALLPALAIAACGGNDSPVTGEIPVEQQEGVSYLGVLVYRNKVRKSDVGSQETSLVANFVKYNIQTNAESVINANSLEVGNCTVANDTTQQSTNSDLPESNPVSAGDSISITSDASLWVTLQNTEQLGLYSSQIKTNIISETPKSLSVSIPGDEFPAVNEMTLPNIPHLENVVIYDGEVEVNTASFETFDVPKTASFSWTPLFGESSRIVISLTNYYSSNGVDTYKSVTCVAADGGFFRIPDRYLDSIEDRYYNIDLYRMERRWEISYDALVGVIAVNEYSFE